MHNGTTYREFAIVQKKNTDKSILSKFILPKTSAVFVILLTSLLAQSPVMAIEVTFSGFMSIVGGKVLDGTRTVPFNDVECPCFISDWTHLGVYNQNTSFNQESRAGVRMNAQVNESLKGVVQVDGRSINGGQGSLEWAYLSYAPASDWEVLLGRKRIPIYFYSDFMDVGFAYPWVRAPQDLYGWEVNNFNGITLAKTGHWSDWSSRASVFLGNEESKANTMSSYFYPGLTPDLSWHHIHGVDLELTRDWFNMRMVYIESLVDLTASTGPLVDAGQQRIYGLSVNIDYDNWLVRSEFSLFDRWRDMGYRSSAEMLAFGYHVGAYTPMLTFSYFVDENSYAAPNWESNTWALSLRYDLNPTSALKVQFDQFHEMSSLNSTTGNANILSVSLDKIF